MNIQQFQYVLAVAESRHFETAAGKCFVTQSTLSTMISKLEDELGIRIFDRKKKPVELTAEGQVIIEHLRTIAKDIGHLRELVDEVKGEIKGKLSISVIPTIAPFLLPLFLQDFATRFPALSIVVKEQTTGEILRQIKSREVDIGIVSVPVHDKDIVETELYNEPFVFYNAGQRSGNKISIHRLAADSLYLLEEGHCMRTQVLNLCDRRRGGHRSQLNFDYQAGSIDSLLRFVKVKGATTLLPYLSTLDFGKAEQRCVQTFEAPVPYRAVGLITHRHFVKKKLLYMLQQDILTHVAPLLQPLKTKGKMLPPL